eukprot:6911288-Pyramimonas_sp.AAC.1
MCQVPESSRGGNSGKQERPMSPRSQKQEPSTHDGKPRVSTRDITCSRSCDNTSHEHFQTT